MTEGIFAIHIMFLVSGFLFIVALPFRYVAQRFIIHDQTFGYWDSYRLLLLLFVAHQFVFRGVAEFSFLLNHWDATSTSLADMTMYIWPLVITLPLLYVLIGKLLRNAFDITPIKIFLLFISGSMITIFMGVVLLFGVLLFLFKTDPVLIM